MKAIEFHAFEDLGRCGIRIDAYVRQLTLKKYKMRQPRDAAAQMPKCRKTSHRTCNSEKNAL